MMPILWGRDYTGKRGFSKAHVKSVFYNYAQKKMLNEKLDDMDKLIEEKIAKAMMSSVQTNDANKVPTSALEYATWQEVLKNKAVVDLFKSGFQYNQNNIIAVHSNIPRGKILNYDTVLTNLGKSDYSDIYVGDIIERTTPAISATTWNSSATRQYVIIGIKCLDNYGDTTPLKGKNYLVLIPLDGLGDAKMNTGNVTTGGYKSSEMNATVIPAVVTALENAFGAAHVLKTREYITNAVGTDLASAAGAGWKGSATAGEWSDQKAILMTELEAHGGSFFSSSGYDNIGYDLQFPGMKIDWVMNRRFNRWLRSVASASYFCGVSSYGYPTAYYASTAFRVAPRFVIG